MFRIHIARSRQPIGQFSPEEVAEGLKSGKFLPTDLAWREPMSAWKPLSEFEDLPSVSAASAEVPPPLDAVITETPSRTEPTEFEPAWERRKELGFFKSLVESLRQTYSNPAATFEKLRLSGGYWEPLFYFLVLACVSFWVSMGYQTVAIMVNPEVVLGSMSKSIDKSYLLATQIFMVVAAPLFFTIFGFVSAGVTHFLLQTFGVKGNFEGTFRALCYAVGPAAFLQVVPICGSMMSVFVSVVLFVLALKAVHGINTLKASAAVLLPTMVCGAVFLGIYAMAVASVVAQGGLK